MAKPKNLAKQVVFFDFDNTITAQDVLDDMLVKFSKDDRWMDLEKKWKNKEIGSFECLKGQVKGIRVNKVTLNEYLSKVKIDPYFKRLIKLLNSKGIRVIILSDNFDYILNCVLASNDIGGMKVFSNRLKIVDDRLIPSFPYANKRCGDCAHCKKTSLARNLNMGEESVYVGDGLSDACASKEADTVFAKDYLKKYLEENDLAHIPFKGLKDVYEYFKNSKDKRSLS